MTNETKRRIAHYQKSLPAMREKVFGAVLMLFIAVLTAVSATYAWVTLSAAPEATSIDTTVTANGALEIALANGTGAAPGKSAEGDSTGAGTPITKANITWGNLVNLSDLSYGLANVTLRPAALNGTSGLLSNPLYGVGYGEDGRVNQMVIGEDFAYTYYDPTAAGAGGGRFLVDLKGEHLGVRAISTVQFENLEGAEQLSEILNWTNQRLTLAKSNYQKITNETAEPGKSYITSLQGLIQVYAQNVIDKKPTNTLDITSYVENLYNMMLDLNDNVMEMSGETYVGMANLLDLMKETSGGSKYSRDKAGVDALIADYTAKKLPSYVTDNMTSLGTFVSDYRQFATYLKTSAKGDFSDLTQSQKNNSIAYWAYYARTGGTVYWSNINGIINWICDIRSATLDGYTMSQLSSMSVAMKVMGNKTHSAVLNKGGIQRIEKRLGAAMSPKITITVDPSGLGGVAALAGEQTFKDVPVTTSAADPREIPTDINSVKAQNSGSFRGDKATAQDTYALAIDLWLRSNAGSDSTVVSTQEISADGKTITTTDPLRSYLTLEGKVRYQEIEERATITAPDGNIYEAYTGTATASGQTLTINDAYKKGDQYYVIAEDGTEKTVEEEYPAITQYHLNVTYVEKYDKKTIVVGYDGVNRVWSDEQMAPYEGDGTSTTQGGGSCYTFYASTPADQSRFLELLGSMRVAFIDAKGNLIGAATMDTEHYYAENGKVTVPLALDTASAINLGDDGNGNVTYGLMPLTKNAATRVTAIVYLDGEKLTNEMVLASGDIQGNLNVQFGACIAAKVTTVTTETDENGNETTTTTTTYRRDSENESIRHEDLMDDRIRITASVDKAEFEYDPDAPAKTNLSVRIAGVDPKRVEVCFIRAISKTQGVQQERIALSGSGEAWAGEISFAKPGNYVLRTVWVDGVEYDLNQEPITVTVHGSSVNSLTCDALPAGSNSVSIMTADASFSANMTLGFTTSVQVPSRVNGIFMDEEGRQVNVPFALEAGIWTGTATFYTSGTYTIQYVEIDDEVYELSEALQKTLILTLGIKAEVRISADAATLQKLQSVMEGAMPTRFVYDRSKLGQTVTLNVALKLYDNGGSEIKAQSGVKLYYGKVGSATGGLDADLSWNAASGSYAGAFGVSAPGTFRFTKVTVELSGTISTITAKTTAPDLQVMPPDDAYYFGNYTEETYQYVPNRDGVLKVGIAYSSAATKVEADITNGTTTATVEGVMGGEAPDQGEKSVNLWSFAVPDEGNWKLNAIKLYGVYYDGRYYDDETGVSVNLGKEDIHAKIVKTLYVTLSGSNQSFTGYFMDDHMVNDLVVTIQDFENKPIEGATVSDVKVVYYLNGGKVGLNTEYGYTADNISSVSIDGTGTARGTSGAEYAISAMNFRQAGPYENCAVSFALKEGDSVAASFTAGVTAGTELKYQVDGSAASNCPRFDVKWHAPDAKFTATNPEVNKKFDGDTNDDKSNVEAVYNRIRADKNSTGNLAKGQEGYYLESHYKASYSSCFGTITAYTQSQATVRLSGVGTHFTKATLTIPSKNYPNKNLDSVFTFTSSNLTNQQKIGGKDGDSRRVLGTTTAQTIVLENSNVAYTLKLAHALDVYNPN